jgi:hypothetical protein
MCLISILHHRIPNAPIGVIFLREEKYDRQSLRPSLWYGRPMIMAGRDLQAGGTWLGVNHQSLLVAVTNRKDDPWPTNTRSRGLLCRELLRLSSASAAAGGAHDELASGLYAGANIVVADPDHSYLISLHRGGIDRITLDGGIHVIGNYGPDVKDLRRDFARQWWRSESLSSPQNFVDSASRLSVAAHGAVEMVVRKADSPRGTVSSTILTVGDSAQACFYFHAEGAPDRSPYIDYSDLFRRMIGSYPSDPSDAPPRSTRADGK